MKIQVDNVQKFQRVYFKNEVLKAIEGKGNVYFVLDKAIVETKEPYFVTEESLIDKSRNKNAINKVISDFRMYQFKSV